MIGSVRNNAGPSSFGLNNRRQANGADFKQEYARRVNQDRASFSQPNADAQQQRGYQEIGPSVEAISRHMQGMNTQATGGAALTDEEIRELKEKYDFQHLSSDQRLDLLRELNQKNVLSYSVLNATTRIAVEFSPQEAESFVQAMRQRPGFEDFEMPAENRAEKNEALTLKLPAEYAHHPQNIVEEYANSAMEWRAKYYAALEQYGEERPEYLKRSDAYAEIADILKSIMEA